MPSRIDLSRLRVALTPDFGFAPTERHIAEVFAEKTGAVPPRLRPRRGHHARLHRRRRGVRGAAGRSASWPAMPRSVRTRPQDVGPNVRANVEEGLRYTAADVARAQTLQTAHVSPLAGLLPATTT